MPSIYLSPSTQEFNATVLGNSEEYYMNLIADALVPYLNAMGIQYTRNTPDMTAASSIRASNAGNYDLHLAIHSNASPESLQGQMRGTDVYYYPASTQGKALADLIVTNMQAIYPNPGDVKALATTSIGEVSRTNAPSVLIETAYHDNYEDAVWLRDNIDAIAQALARSLAEYFGIPFVSPTETGNATVNISSGTLNIRASPDLSAPVVATAQRGDPITILGRENDWYRVSYNGREGYAYASYISPA